VSLLQELKRRKVVKIGVGYLVAAWLLIQVGATIAPQLNLPDWVPRLITLLALLGFPITIVLAWLFERTDEGIKLDIGAIGNKRVFVAAAVIAALALGWFLRGGMPAGHDAGAATLGARSTAVLPFLNMSSDKENDYFSDGLTENLLHKLAQVSDLKVAARTSSFAFKGKEVDVREIGRSLGVATLVEGSVQRAGDTLRITAQLVRSNDGSHVWSQRYDRKLADLFAIQDEIAGAVTEALVGALVPDAKAAIAQGGTKNLSAYDAYTRGLQQLSHFSFDSLHQAERLFQQALGADSGYVDAMVALARTWNQMQDTGMITQSELVARWAPWLDRIEAIDPGNGALLGFRARVAALRGDRDNARKLFERARAAAPNDADVAFSYAQFLRRFDRPAALEQLDRALLLDPANSSVHVTRARVLVQLNRNEEATVSAKRAIAVDPLQPNSYDVLAEIAEVDGDIVGQIAALIAAHRVDPRDHEVSTTIAEFLAHLGEFAAAESWIADAERNAPAHIFIQARKADVAFLRGDLAAALDQGLAVAPRIADNVKDSWIVAVSDACFAGALLGRTDEIRGKLEQLGVFPHDLTPAAFRALDTTHITSADRVRDMSYLTPCLVGSSTGDAVRRRDMLASLNEIAGADWATEHGFWTLDGLLRADRERIVQGVLPEAGKENELSYLAWKEANARALGVADDPRITGYFARLHQRLDQAKGELPKRLAQLGVAMTP